MYACHLADFCSYNQINQYITAIKHYRKQVKKPKKMLQLKMVLSGIKRSIINTPSRPSRLPITSEKLYVVKKRMPDFVQGMHNQRMYWCACLFAYYGFLRLSEYTNPTVWTHKKSARTLTIKQTSHTKHHVSIKLRKTKTDQSSKGTTIILARNDTQLCPLKAYEKYLSSRGEEKGPLFKFENQSYLTPNRFNKFIKNVLPAEEDGVFTSHSFRIGAASTAAAQNYPTYVIQQLGRWASENYTKYIKIDHNFRSRISADMASTSCSKRSNSD